MICELHFLERCFIEVEGRKVLTKNALPSVFDIVILRDELITAVEDSDLCDSSSQIDVEVTNVVEQEKELIDGQLEHNRILTQLSLNLSDENYIHE